MSVSSVSPGIHENSRESSSEDFNPEIVIGAAKTDGIAHAAMPKKKDEDSSEIEIGSVSPMPSPDNNPQPDPVPEPEPAPVPDPAPQPTPPPAPNDNNGSNPPEKPKKSDWITIAVTTSSAALAMIAVLASSFIVSSFITGINPFTFPVAIIVGLVGGVSCGLTLYFRQSIVNGIDKLLNKIFKRSNPAT